MLQFCSQPDVYFDLVELHDDSKRCKIAITLLEGSAYTWYTVQGILTSWHALKSAMLAYFKPVDYTFKTRQDLLKWTQCGSVTEYIVGFSERLTRCTDVNEDKAMFYFVDGLSS